MVRHGRYHSGVSGSEEIRRDRFIFAATPTEWIRYETEVMVVSLCPTETVELPVRLA